MKKLAFAFAAVLSIYASASAQNNAPPTHEFFRFDFVLKETEGGKLINVRSFQMMAPGDDNVRSSIRSGDRIPVPASSGGTGAITYLDVGVSVDVMRLHHIGEELTFDVIGEASSAEPGTNIIRQAKWNSTVLIPIRKATVIFSSDGPIPKRQLQLEVTATPVH